MVLLGASVPILGGAAAEFFLRKAGFEFEPWRHYRRFGANFEADEIANYERDPDLFWRFRPSRTIRSWWTEEARINRHGFRGEDFQEEKPAGAFRVLCLGDSGTFGWAMKDERAYPAVLQDLLRERMPGRRVEVINAGVPGYSSHQGLALLKRFGGRFDPDVVIFSFGCNDHNPTAWLSDRRRRRVPRPFLELQNRLLRSRAYQWAYMKSTLYFYSRHRRAFLGGDRETLRVPPEEYRENLVQASELCRLAGRRLIFLPRSQQQSYIDIMRGVAEEYGREFIDLTQYPNEPRLEEYLLGEHTGDEAVYWRLARIIADRIVDRP